jgi:hypothetical protein
LALEGVEHQRNSIEGGEVGVEHGWLPTWRGLEHSKLCAHHKAL